MDLVLDTKTSNKKLASNNTSTKDLAQPFKLKQLTQLELRHELSG